MTDLERGEKEKEKKGKGEGEVGKRRLQTRISSQTIYRHAIGHSYNYETLDGWSQSVGMSPSLLSAFVFFLLARSPSLSLSFSLFLFLSLDDCARTDCVWKKKLAG